MQLSETPKLMVCLPDEDDHVDGKLLRVGEHKVRRNAERLGFRVGETEIWTVTAVSTYCQNGYEEFYVHFDWCSSGKMMNSTETSSALGMLLPRCFEVHLDS